MQKSARTVYALVGLIVAAIGGILGNLLAAAIQQRLLHDQFTDTSIVCLSLLLLAGLLAGYWLGAPVHMSATKPSATLSPDSPAQEPVAVTRLRAFLSYAKLRGKGISLADIILFGSRLDIDTRDADE